MAVQTPIPRITAAQAKVLFRIGRHPGTGWYQSRYVLNTLVREQLVELRDGDHEITQLGRDALAKFEAMPKTQRGEGVVDFLFWLLIFSLLAICIAGLAVSIGSEIVCSKDPECRLVLRKHDWVCTAEERVGKITECVRYERTK